jgi:HK97 family phage portal protein
MKLFGWKSAGRAAARPAKLASHLGVHLTRVAGLSGYGDWPRSYEAQLREGYLANPVAQRAVRLVAEGVASAPLVASEPRAAALVAATSGGQALMETLAAQLLLHGNGYVQLLSAPDGTLAELYALRPERVSVEADARGWPAAFRYRAGEFVTRLNANEVIHIRTHHPLDDHYGLGCLGAASGAIAIHNASSRWNKALLDNAARPSGALVHDAAEALSVDQFERLKDELASQFSGQDNAGRPMLLEGGLKWQSLSLSPADMDFAGLKAAAAREIALAFGVPPMLLGLPGDATYANYREANKALWRQAILPLAGKILEALAQGLRPWFGGLTLSVDLDRVAALAEDRERLWAQVRAADFMTVNEKRAAVGLAPLDLEELQDEEADAREAAGEAAGDKVADEGAGGVEGGARAWRSGPSGRPVPTP